MIIAVQNNGNKYIINNGF